MSEMESGPTGPHSSCSLTSTPSQSSRHSSRGTDPCHGFHRQTEGMFLCSPDPNRLKHGFRTRHDIARTQNAMQCFTCHSLKHTTTNARCCSLSRRDITRSVETPFSCPHLNPFTAFTPLRSPTHCTPWLCGHRARTGSRKQLAIVDRARKPVPARQNPHLAAEQIQSIMSFCMKTLSLGVERNG